MSDSDDVELTTDMLDAVITTTTDTAALAPIPDEWDDASLASLHDNGDGDSDDVRVLAPGDLRLADYRDQVSAAVHGDANVFTLDPLIRQRIEQLSHALAVMVDLVERPWPRDPAQAAAKRAAIVRRAGGVLWHNGDGTPFRCCQCSIIYIGLPGEPDLRVAGREDTTCPACTLAAPRHAARKPAPATAGRRRTPRKPAPKAGTP